MLRAKFKTDLARIAFFADDLNRSFHADASDWMNFQSAQVDDGVVEVIGKAQDVMFLIGHVAAHGENFLVSVSQ